MHAFLIETTDLTNLTPPFNYANKVGAIIKKIEDVREFQSLLRYPPQIETLYEIQGLEDASIEAQNAILKLLEEPPNEYINFLLLVSSSEKLLPTILSRVQILKKGRGPVNNFINEASFSNLSKGEQINLISKIKDREEAIDFLTKIAKNDLESASTRDRALDAIEKLSKNANVLLVLLNFLAT